jgi:hypothetical protein
LREQPLASAIARDWSGRVAGWFRYYLNGA